MAELGTRMLVAAFSLWGDVSPEKGVALMDALCNLIGVKKVHRPVHYSYPTDGLGGNGYTLIQPISDSFFALDAWPDLGGGYLVLCSCRLFWVKEVMHLLTGKGYRVLEVRPNELSLLEDELTTG